MNDSEGHSVHSYKVVSLNVSIVVRMPKANATGGGVLDLEAYKRSILEKAGINPEGSKRPKSAGNSTSASEKLKDQKAAETIEPPKEVRQKKALVIGELQENFKALTNGNGNAASTAPPPTPPKPTISQPIRHSDSSGDNGWISVGSLQQPSDNKLSIEVPSDQHKAEGKRDSESHEIPEFMVSPGSHPSQSTRREAYHRYIQKIKVTSAVD